MFLVFHINPNLIIKVKYICMWLPLVIDEYFYHLFLFSSHAPKTGPMPTGVYIKYKISDAVCTGFSIHILIESTPDNSTNERVKECLLCHVWFKQAVCICTVFRKTPVLGTSEWFIFYIFNFAYEDYMFVQGIWLQIILWTVHRFM